MSDSHAQATIWPVELPLTRLMVDALRADPDDIPEAADLEEGELHTEADKLMLGWIERHGLEQRLGLTIDKNNPDDTWYLYCETGVEEGVPAVLQELLREMPTVPYLFIEGAVTTNKMMPGGFGGYGCIITRHAIKWGSTHAWRQAHTEGFWSADELQFARLLDEIQAAGVISIEGWEAVARAMDLSVEQVDELFQRATARFEFTKEILMARELAKSATA